MDRVFLCDVVEPPSSGLAEFLWELFKRCRNFGCDEQYFEADFLLEQQDTTAADLPSGFVDKSKFCAHFRKKTIDDVIKDKTEKDGKELTPLGKFVVQNYRCTKNEHYQYLFFSSQSPEAEWIFYCAVSPTKYADLIQSIANYYGEGQDYENDSPTKVILLEKPFQKNSDDAKNLQAVISQIMASHKSVQVYAVDHYAAKWSLSQIPDLLRSIPDFKRFVAGVDEIIIELLERKTIPKHRLGYMAETGLYLDMMPHALVPLQFLYESQYVEIEEVIPLALGQYNGYQEELDAWLAKLNKSDANLSRAHLKAETYFSMKILLRVRENRQAKESKQVTVYIRSGKGMIAERKSVILLNKTGTQCDDEVGYFEIDIANESFLAPNERAGFALPKRILEPKAAKRKIIGYAKIFFDMMQYLGSSRVFADTVSDGDTDVRMNTIPELLEIESAVQIIRDMEHMEQQFDQLRARTLRKYQVHEHWILDKDVEAAFLTPFQHHDGIRAN